VQGVVRNTGDPSASPSSRQGASYKPKAKTAAAQRESEGVAVPTRRRSDGRSPLAPYRTNVVQNNATGGKGPCGGGVVGAGTREGMLKLPRSRRPTS
jgi:hypothetical protein